MNFMQILDYYKRPEITTQLVENARNREVAGALRAGGFGQRPNILQFHSDVIHMVQSGVVSFHYSVERWPQPMSLGMKNYQTQRMGWDFVLDIDSKLGIEEAKIAALLVCRFLEGYGIKNYGIKFSGSRGFHIALPWIMFPKELDYQPLSQRYPEASQVIAGFIREKIRDPLTEELMKIGVKGAGETDPFYFIELEKNWSIRHMFRAPYSLNEKSWLVSVPITKDMLKNFSAECAKPENVKTDVSFFKGDENEAQQLLIDAIDWAALQKKDEPGPKRSYVNMQRIPESAFPPCIKTILMGLEDGRKRGLFVLLNFLKTVNWKQEEIEERIRRWNKLNKEPLPESIINGQLRYHENKEPVPPANCSVERYYKDIGICMPDATCKTIKNTAGYALKKAGSLRGKIEYKCSVCSRGFKNMKSLSMHQSRSHGIIQ
ncbi:MAG: hypothetical protein HZB66_02815 [Candidatus Aenigmarchaeota archaeon]|nr:hypothetical protein [Candidatus Aenigmarchaeota archaeon]